MEKDAFIKVIQKIVNYVALYCVIISASTAAQYGLYRAIISPAMTSIICVISFFIFVLTDFFFHFSFSISYDEDEEKK